MSQDCLKAILLLSCPDQVGLVSRISHFIFEKGGNILDLDEHVDPNNGNFYIRITWDMSHFQIPQTEVKEAFAPIAKELNATWQLHFSNEIYNVAIFVSKYDHCLQEILWRCELGEFAINIALIISNHSDLKPLAERYQIPFYVFPITKENKLEQEEQELELLERYNIDTIILARYMQILSPQLVHAFPNQIINIHHSFLPAFVGKKPYSQAFERGVKIIGATAHYVTKELDEGPIIEQDITRVSHRDNLKDLIRKGRDLERLVLARSIAYHTENRILLNGNKTLIFN